MTQATKAKADVDVVVTAYCNDCGAEREFGADEQAFAWKERHEVECPEAGR